MASKPENKTLSDSGGKAAGRFGGLLQTRGVEELAVLIHDRMGLHFPEDKKGDLIQGIARAGEALAFASTDSFVDFLLANEWDREIFDSIVSELTIGETYFFRDRKIFDMIQNCVVPEKRKDRKLKFWSAACSTGEEPYSLAVMLDRTIPDISKWDIEIIASDIDREALRKAERGVYRPWSFRESQFPAKGHYFRKRDSGSFEMHRKIKKMVKFFRLNLKSEEYPSALNGTTDCDVIFCRNVLIYFSLDVVEKVVERLYRCLKPGGLLVLSATELAFVSEGVFELVELCGNLVLRRAVNPKGISGSLSFKFRPPGKCEVRANPGFAENEDRGGGLNRRDGNAKDVKGRGGQSAIGAEMRVSGEGNQGLLASDEKYKEAKLLADGGKSEDAIQMCRQAIEEDALSVKWNYLYCVALFESGKVVDAAKAISRVLYLDADNVMGHVMSGHINNALGKGKMAKKNFDNALMILKGLSGDDVVPGSGGVRAERLMATIEAVYGGI